MHFRFIANLNVVFIYVYFSRRKLTLYLYFCITSGTYYIPMYVGINEDNAKKDKSKKVKDEQEVRKPHAPILVTVIVESVMLTKCIPQLY